MLAALDGFVCADSDRGGEDADVAIGRPVAKKVDLSKNFTCFS